MSRLFSVLASAVLRNVQIPEDATAPSVLALADAKKYLNERHHDVWARRLWRESIILGTFSVPAGTKRIALTDIVVDTGFGSAGSGYSGTFVEIMGVREGNNPLLAEDASAINLIDASIWARTTSPVSFINRGSNGILLNGAYSEATTLSFFGKSDSQDLADGETWVLDPQGQAILEGATGDMIRDHDRDDNRARVRYDLFQGEVAALIDQQAVQGANSMRVIPVNPWTAFGYEVTVNSNTRTGFSSIY